MSPRRTVCHQTRRRWKSWLKWQNREGYQFFIFYSWKFVTPNKILIKFLSYMFILYLTAGWSLCKDILWRPHEEAVRVNWPGSPWLPGYRKQRSEHAQEVNTHLQFSGLKTESMWPWFVSWRQGADGEREHLCCEPRSLPGHGCEGEHVAAACRWWSDDPSYRLQSRGNRRQRYRLQEI
jgi:hypothetical protein